MTTELYPLTFAPLYKDYLWGGDSIRRHFQRDIPLPVCAESWELSDRPEGESVVRNGPLAGTSLRDLLRQRAREMLGPAADASAFPLLIKILDARERLSVQVHPDQATASRFGGEPKTEMWIVLEAAAQACVYAGLLPGTTPDALRRALDHHTVERLLRRIPVAKGDAIFVPGGRVHAIGAGCLMLEVQQNSNTTHRLYDWDRVGPDGKPRDLHVARALDVIDWEDRTEPRLRPEPLELGAEVSGQRLADCAYFRVDQLDLRGPSTLPKDHEGCDILFISQGSLVITASSGPLRAPAGTTCLLPAVLGATRLAPEQGSAQVVRIVPRA